MEEKVIAERYILQEKVGEGSYSVVYKGFDKDENRKVAVKEMKSAGLTKEEADEAHELFFREMNILKDIKFNYIPEIYDFCLFENRNFMVMQWLEGEDLLSFYRRQGKLLEWQALSYMRQITDALVYLQDENRSIIYKDLKPSNILLDERGQVKIIDFGTARHYNPQKKKDTHILGTPGYAPPEAYTETQTDFSADVYSLGATFYHLTTGEEPFRFRFNFPDPREFSDELSEEFAELLTDCLKKRGERISDARELKKRIMRALGEEVREASKAEEIVPTFYPTLYIPLMFPFFLLFLFVLILSISKDFGGYFFFIFIFYYLGILFFQPIYILYCIWKSKYDSFSLILAIILYIILLSVAVFFYHIASFPDP